MCFFKRILVFQKREILIVFSPDINIYVKSKALICKSAIKCMNIVQYILRKLGMYPASIKIVADLEKSLTLDFHDKVLLDQALTHSSYLNENNGKSQNSNERLEFLGDSVLGLIIARQLYNLHPDWQEGTLTEAKSILVRGDTLAKVSIRLNLGKYLYLGKGEEMTGGRNRASNLAALYEAIIGAIFLDKGFDASEKFVLNTLQPEIAQLSHRETYKNSKSELQEKVQSLGIPPPTYKTTEASGTKHNQTFIAEVYVNGQKSGSGSGSSKSNAEINAAIDALNRLT